jgi:hypothetical protein
MSGCATLDRDRRAAPCRTEAKQHEVDHLRRKVCGAPPLLDGLPALSRARHRKRDGPEGTGGRRSGPSAPLASTLGVDPPRWRSRINRSTPEAAHTVYVPWRLISFDLSQDSELSTTGFAPRLTDGLCSPFAGMLTPLPACRCLHPSANAWPIGGARRDAISADEDLPR